MSRNDDDYHENPFPAAADHYDDDDGHENDHDERMMEMSNNLLMDLLQDEKWNDILENLKHQQQQQQQTGDGSSCANHVWSLQEQVAFVWSNTCSIKPSVVPIGFVHALFGLLSSDESDDCVMCIHEDAVSMYAATFLHMAVTHCANRPDIIQVLLAKNTGSADMMFQNVMDAEGLRPIDILTQRILMKEERLRYQSKQPSQSSQSSSTITATRTNNTDLDDCWESARLLAISHGRTSAAAVLAKELRFGHCDVARGLQERCFPTSTHFPLLHACCLAMDNVPHSLLQRALRRCPNEEFMLRADAIHGYTPLHCAAAAFRRPVAVIVEDQQEQEENDDVVDTDDCDNNNSNFNDDLLGEVLRREPKAAGVLNHDNQYPLDVAILAGRTWKSGCRLLLEAHPAAILHVLPSEKNETNNHDDDDDDDDKNNDIYNFDTASSHQTQRLLMEVFSKTSNGTAGGGGFNLTYAILHVIQPQVLFE